MNERKLTKSELAKREDIIMKMKDNKRALVQKYGKDAEAVMYGRATNLAKKKSEGMDQDKIKELVKDALQNPKKADLNKDGKLSDYEKKRGAAIEKSMVKELDLDLKGGTEKDKDADIAGVVGAESALGLEENLNESKEAGLDELKSIVVKNHIVLNHHKLHYIDLAYLLVYLKFQFQLKNNNFKKILNLDCEVHTTFLLHCFRLVA